MRRSSSNDDSYMWDSRSLKSDERLISDIVVEILSSKTREVGFYKFKAHLEL